MSSRSAAVPQSSHFEALQALKPGLHTAATGMSDLPPAVARQAAELEAARAEAAELRAERDRLLEQRNEIAQLLKSSQPDKIMHDLRNILNELQLLKMLADAQD